MGLREKGKTWWEGGKDDGEVREGMLRRRKRGGLPMAEAGRRGTSKVGNGRMGMGDGEKMSADARWGGMGA
jgi:hypothetical protein